MKKYYRILLLIIRQLFETLFRGDRNVILAESEKKNYFYEIIDINMKLRYFLSLSIFVMPITMVSAQEDSIEAIRSVEAVVQMDEVELYTLLLPESVGAYSDKLYRFAQKGNAAAANSLGDCFLKGNGIGIDYEKSFFWFSKAAEGGNLKALNNLGFCYENGYGVTKDAYQAYSFYRKAAMKGSPDAFVNVANCYYCGIGTSINKEKALAWFEKGAKLNYRVAQLYAGLINYENEDFSAAISFFEQAAEQGSDIAWFNLGHCYSNEKAKEYNLVKAQECFRNAYKLGCNDAKDYLE